MSEHQDRQDWLAGFHPTLRDFDAEVDARIQKEKEEHEQNLAHERQMLHDSVSSINGYAIQVQINRASYINKYLEHNPQVHRDNPVFEGMIATMEREAVVRALTMEPHKYIEAYQQLGWDIAKLGDVSRYSELPNPLRVLPVANGGSTIMLEHTQIGEVEEWFEYEVIRHDDADPQVVFKYHVKHSDESINTGESIEYEEYLGAGAIHALAQIADVAEDAIVNMYITEGTRLDNPDEGQV